MDLKEIRAVIDLMTKHGLSEFELEKADFKIRVKRGADGQFHSSVSPVAAPAPVVAVPAAAPAPAAPAESKPAAKEDSGLKDIVSPMVGTFYSSPSPDSEPYVKAGDVVDEDTVVCIIEAMKVMNEIKAEMSGTVVEVLGVNGKPVEFGKPLFTVRPK